MAYNGIRGKNWSVAYLDGPTDNDGQHFRHQYFRAFGRLVAGILANVERPIALDHAISCLLFRLNRRQIVMREYIEEGTELAF